jgi:hypothetical protein
MHLMKTKNWIALLPVALLAACALEPRRIEAPPETRIIVQPALPSDADLLLGHIAGVRKLDAREFAAERDIARNQFQRDRSDFNRIKYALILALIPAASTSAAATVAQDDVELMSLIEPLVSTAGPGTAAGDSQIRALAALLQGMVIDRRRVREQLRETQVRLALARKDDTRDAEARALRARVDELEARLNALKSIDRSVNRRAESVSK